MRRTWGSITVAGLASMGAVALVVAVPAAPAAAHAELVSSEPASGEVLATPPDEVALHFTEGVQIDDEAIEVFDSSGDQLDVGDPGQADGGAVVTAALPDLDDGAYVVTWRVTSADSHPIHGAFTFRVGPAGDDEEAQALMSRLVSEEGGSTLVGVVYGAVRFVGFAGMVLLVGGVALLLALWPAGRGDPRARRLVVAGWWTFLVTTVLGFGLQGAYAAAEPLSGALDPSLIGDVLDTRAGQVWLVRLLLLAVVGVVGWRLLPTVSVPRPADGQPAPRFPAVSAWRAEPGRVALAVVVGVALLATISAAGHASAGDLVPLALVVDVVHLAAVSFWLGGLTLLVLVVLRLPAEPADVPRPRAAGADVATPPETPAPATGPDDVLDARQARLLDVERVVRGFSQLAFVAVVVIVITGTIQGWRQTRTVDGLVDTTYGRLLLVKVALVTLMLLAAAFSRQWVLRRARRAAAATDATDVTGDARSTLRGLRRSVGAEVLVAGAVLAVTALLVNTEPGTDALDQSFSQEVHGAELLMRVEVDPASAGPTDITVETLTHTGEPAEAREVTASLTLPDRDIGPMPLTLEPAGEGRYRAERAEIPFPGTWELEVDVRISEFEQETLTAEVPID